MSTHPNAMLLLVLRPDDLARKTYRAILAELNPEKPEEDYVKIEGKDYHSTVMERDYDEGHQISAPEGSIVFWDLVTYGYGEHVPWKELTKQVDGLEGWAVGVCRRHHCSYEILVGANYW